MRVRVRVHVCVHVCLCLTVTKLQHPTGLRHPVRIYADMFSIHESKSVCQNKVAVPACSMLSVIHALTSLIYDLSTLFYIHVGRAYVQDVHVCVCMRVCVCRMATPPGVRFREHVCCEIMSTCVCACGCQCVVVESHRVMSHV